MRNGYKTLIGLVFLGIFLTGCDKAPVSDVQAGVTLQLRADAVEPAKAVDIMYELNGALVQKQNVAPGTYFDLGAVPAGTKVKFSVHNTNGSGEVRANILTENCFRMTGKCDSLNCTAAAEYVVVKEGCVNY